MSHEQFALSLLNLPGIGRKSAWKIARSAKLIPETGKELFEVLASGNGSRGLTLQNVEDAWAESARVLEESSQNCIQAWAASRPDFPKWIRDIPDPPLILYVRGDVDCIRTPLSVAVIGTREPTSYGELAARRFGKRLAEFGCVVVSGLAVGCDTAGHRGCLEAGGKTVAVLAHGLHSIYPKQSRELAEEILESGGCWVSEYPFGMRAQRSFFVERDRLQSAMSAGLIVVETDTDGGTMHTVRAAEAQGRLVACMYKPSEYKVTDKSRGNNLLVESQRATALTTAEDFGKYVEEARNRANRMSLNGENGHAEAKSHETPASDLFSGESRNGGSAI
jgi:DNA processing protein